MSEYWMLNIESWAGRRQVPVEVVEPHPKRSKVRLLESARLPNKKFRNVGEVVSVPTRSLSRILP